MPEELRASADTPPKILAGAIAGEVRSHTRCEVVCIGAGAVNQAVKAIAIARGYLAPGGRDIICIPSFVEIGEDSTGIKLKVEIR